MYVFITDFDFKG